MMKTKLAWQPITLCQLPVTAYPTRFPSSCLFFTRTPSKCISASSPTCPNPTPAYDRHISKIYQPQSAPVRGSAFLSHVQTGWVQTTSHISEPVLLNEINIWCWGEEKKNRGQIDLLSFSHTLIPCHGPTSARPSQWITSTAFEYRERNASSRCERKCIQTDELTGGRKSLQKSL